MRRITRSRAASAAWWQRGIIYQIYPRSFADSDGDGVGDLRGIRERIEYLSWLGVDAIWISPIYPSPMADFGYDISDYTSVDPVFGTLEDFDAMVAAAHAARIKVILDFVPNHTSDQHPWFRESRASRGSPRRDWYIWRDPGPNGAPNNWRSVFGGSAWEWDGATGQYYYHAYLKEQPDLNWRNPAVRAAMLDVLRFWLERGVDGFRVDAIHQLFEDEALRDNPPNPSYQPTQAPYFELLGTHTVDLPEVQEVIAQMRRVLDEYTDRVMITEAYLPLHQVVRYYGAGGAGAHLPFNFLLITLPWDARRIAGAIDAYEAALPPGAWPNWVLGNHDRPRVASRVGVGQARVAGMLLLTLRGTPTMYYGDEIGMRDVAIPRERVRDPWELQVPGLGLGRDPERTPMQWSRGANAGFTTGVPWLPVADDHETTNVEVEQGDPRSLLTLYRGLIALRRAEPALAMGSYAAVPTGGDVLGYAREHRGQRFLVLLNFGHAARSVELDGRDRGGRIVLSTYLDREGDVGAVVELRGDEGVIVAARGTGRSAERNEEGGMQKCRVSTMRFQMRLALVVGALPVLACARRAEPPVSDPNVPIEVRPGAEFSLLLESNPSTGYRWELGDLAPGGVVAPLSSQFQPGAGRRGVPGAGGRERWTFRALVPGDVRVPLIYARPGEGNVARDTAWYTVHVR